MVSFCDGDRFSFPSWQLEVQERTNSSLVLVPDYMEKGKEITTYISSIIKRSLFSTIPNKKFKDYFKALSQSTRCGALLHKIIFPGYQEDDIVPEDPTPTSYQLSHKGLYENSEEKVNHKYVFTPEGKHTNLFNVCSRLLQLSGKK